MLIYEIVNCRDMRTIELIKLLVAERFLDRGMDIGPFFRAITRDLSRCEVYSGTPLIGDELGVTMSLGR